MLKRRRSRLRRTGHRRRPTRVGAADDEVDRVYDQVYHDLVKIMIRDPSSDRGGDAPALGEPQPRAHRRPRHEHRRARGVHGDGGAAGDGRLLVLGRGSHPPSGVSEPAERGRVGGGVSVPFNARDRCASSMRGPSLSEARLLGLTLGRSRSAGGSTGSPRTDNRVAPPNAGVDKLRAGSAHHEAIGGVRRRRLRYALTHGTLRNHGT